MSDQDRERKRIEDFDADEQMMERVELGKDDEGEDFEGHRMEVGKVEPKVEPKVQDI